MYKKLSFAAICFLAMAVTTSCGLFMQRVNEQMAQSAQIQNASADSLKLEIIKQRSQFQEDKNFADKMDTVYQSGFRLTELYDSVTEHKNEQVYLDAYKKELHFFRNYVNHNFYFSDEINNGLMTMGMSMNFQQSNTGNIPFNPATVFSGMVKTSTMQVILSCRSQYLKKDSIE